MAQQLEAQKQLFRFQKVQLFKTKPLGIGSYGSVCKAMCDELPCAAKILHPTILNPHNPGARTQRTVQQFEQECDFLSRIRHPHIVQYLGVTKDPELGLQVLLMELMDESLTTFLENAQEPIPYHIQVNLCHDIALALAFLHSIQITHRDLSSNNVLLIGGIRAKVTDFGMSRLGNISPHKDKLTECPGASVYMPPEAFGFRLKYNHKLDCFSFGVLGVQIMTGIFPDPSDSERIVAEPKYRTGTLKEVVPEIERRKDHIDLIDPNHPLLTVALICLKDREKERPTSQELCRHLSSLKEASRYTESEHKSKGITKSSMARRERQIKEQYDQQIQEFQFQLTAQRSAEAKIFQGMHQEREQLQDKLEAQQQHVSYQNYQIQQLQQEKKELQDKLQQQEQQISYQKHQIQQLQQHGHLNAGATCHQDNWMDYQHPLHQRTCRRGSEQTTIGRRGNEQMTIGRHGSEQTTIGGRGNEQMTIGRHGSEQVTISRRGSEQVTIGRRSNEQTTIGGRGSEQVTIGGRGNEQTTIGGRGNEQTTIGRRGNEQTTIGGCGSEQVTIGRRGNEQMTIGGRGSEQMTIGRRGIEQMTAGGCGSEQTQNAGGNLYANISETLMESDREVSTSQSSTAKHEHEQSQPAEPVWIPTKNPQLYSSEKSYSFQEKLQDLFQQFPGLVVGQEASSPPALVEGEETANPTYQDIVNLLPSDVVLANQLQESLTLNISELPEPVVQSEVELEQLAMQRQNRSGLMSINNLDIKDARSVRDESGFGPCYESLSIFSPDRSPAATSSTQVHREVEEAWKVHNPRFWQH